MKKNEVPLISIVIPIYKVERWLRECVDSVLNQTYTNIEVILVDDGSPDGCPAICDEYALRDNRIKVIHKTNAGLSEARNSGLDASHGQYVFFIDSDDYYLHEDFISLLVESAVQNVSDMVIFKRRKLYEETKTMEPDTDAYNDEILQERNPDSLWYKLAVRDDIDASASMKLLKREVLTTNQIYFRKGMFSEDVEWYFRLSRFVHRISAVSRRSYCYRVREGSITHCTSGKNINDLFFSVETYAKFIQESRMNGLKKTALLNYLCYQWGIVIGLTGNILKGKERKDMLQKCKEYKWLTKYAISPKTKKVALVIDLLGIRLSSCILGFYITHR